MLFDLPIEEDPDTENQEKTSKIKGIMSKEDKKKLVITAIIGALIVILTFSLGTIAMKKVPENASPYCMLMKEEGKLCRIHNKKHDTKKLSELVVSEDEMALHKQLFEEVSNGAYFDGKRLYKKDDAKEILAIKDIFNKEIASLFEKYLSDTLTEEEKKRYNFIKEELVTIDESIKKLEIKEEEKDEPSKEELTEEIEKLKEQLDEAKVEREKEITPIAPSVQEADVKSKETTSETVQEKVQQDKLLYASQTSETANIPKDIENAATIKKSALYN